MPAGAFREDLRSTTLFRDFAAENAESWYRFINGPCGWELGNGELRLITGCDKTTSWGLAAYQNIQSEGESSDSLGGSLLRFKNTSDAGVPGTTYCWEHEGTAEVKAGPEFEVDEDMPGNGARPRNQCTFIRSHTVMLSEAGWARVQSTLVSALDSRRASKPAQPQSTSSSSFLTGAFSHLSKQQAPYLQLDNVNLSTYGVAGIFGSHRNTGSATMSDSHNPSAVSSGSTTNFLSHRAEKVIHPSTFLAEMLLRKVLTITLRHLSVANILKHPNVDVAVVHDDHWGAVVEEVGGSQSFCF